MKDVMPDTDAERLHKAIQEIRTRLSRIHHNINNPLSIVSGNMQLLHELSLSLEIKADFSEPLQDVEAALELLMEWVDELMVLRNSLADL